MKHPMYGAEASISDAIADAAAAGTLADLAAAEAKIDLLKDKVNAIIAALEKFGVIES